MRNQDSGLPEIAQHSDVAPVHVERTGAAAFPGPSDRPLSVMLIDPSRYTTPYDAGLAGGLNAVGVATEWITRPRRHDEVEDLDPAATEALFYRRTDSDWHLPSWLRPLAKGSAHAMGVAALLQRIARKKPDVVHFQWTIIPLLDALVISLIRRSRPVVLTVHDTVPFNGQPVPLLKRAGFDFAARRADHLIVHTDAALETLASRGFERARISVIPHGPLHLRVRSGQEEFTPTDPRYTFVLFGSLKPYKGVDVLVEAICSLPADARTRFRVIIAGDPRIDLAPLREQVASAGLEEVVEFRLGRLPEHEVATVLKEADAFVLPYRQIDASGVYHLIRPLGKWIIASRVGVFADELDDDGGGVTVPPGEPAALASAMANAIDHRPQPRPPRAGTSWNEIGAQTRQLYEILIARRERSARTTASTDPAIPSGQD